MKRKLLIGFGLLGATLLGFEVWQRTSFDAAPWLNDLDRLESHLASSYANLDWLIEQGRVAPSELDHTTRESIRASSTDREAARALRAMVTAFRDPHLRLEEPSIWRDLESWWTGAGTPLTRAGWPDETQLSAAESPPPARSRAVAMSWARRCSDGVRASRASDASRWVEWIARATIS